MFACFKLMPLLPFLSALWLIIIGVGLELCKHAESHQSHGNNHYISVFINMFIRTKTTQSLMNFMRETMIKAETKDSVLSTFGLLVLFFYCFVCPCCVRVFKEWMPNTVNVNEAQDISNLPQGNKSDFFIWLRPENIQ